MMPTGTTTPERAARWQRFLGDIENYALVPQPLEMQGTLVRVTGLVLEAAGVSPAEVLVGGYDAADAHAPLLASYVYEKAEIPRCGRQSEFTHTAANEVDANFGCSVTANMAAQIANPSDIAGPRGEDAPDADRRLTVLGKYREGKVTNSDDAEGKSGVISSVAR